MSSYWDGVAQRYHALYDNEWSLFEDSVLKSDLQRLVGQTAGKRILDVGCGMGLGYELLGGVASGADYVGVDISGAMLHELRERHPTVRTVQLSGDSLTPFFTPGQFDAVISINVAASFPAHTQQLIQDVFTVLVPGGSTYLSFLNRHSLRRIVHGRRGAEEQYRTRGDDNNSDFAWAKTYARQELTSMCRTVGFDNIRCCYRSVLGGVWESPAAVTIERILDRFVPCLGHAIVVTGVRAAEGGNSDEVEAILRA